MPSQPARLHDQLQKFFSYLASWDGFRSNGFPQWAQAAWRRVADWCSSIFERRIFSRLHGSEQTTLLFWRARLGVSSQVFSQTAQDTGTLILLLTKNYPTEDVRVQAGSVTPQGIPMSNLPRPVSTGDTYLAAIHGALAEQNTLLGEIRDRLGQANDKTPPAETPGPQPVDLREPEPAAKAELTEPAAKQTESPPKKRSVKPARGVVR